MPSNKACSVFRLCSTISRLDRISSINLRPSSLPGFPRNVGGYVGSLPGPQGASERFRRLEPFLTGRPDGPSYREIGADLGMAEGAVKGAVHRMRRRFGRLLREEVAQTLGDSEQLEDELRHLFAVLDT